MGIENAISVMNSGKLHRYNTDEGEISITSQLEVLFSKWQGAKYCLACTSGGVAIQLALRSSGVKPGDKVLANAFTLAPVPGAIENVGAKAVLVGESLMRQDNILTGLKQLIEPSSNQAE